MTKEQLINLGLSEELASKIAGESKKELENYVEKSKYIELEIEKKQIGQTLQERDKQLEELKKNSGDNIELKKQIEKLQADNKVMEENHHKELNNIKLNGAIDIALTNAKVKNLKAVRALLNQENIKLKDDGSIEGIKEQIEELKKSDAYLFENEKQQVPKGFIPGSSSGNGEEGKPKGLADAVQSFFNGNN